MAWYDKSGGPSFIELYEEAAGDQCGICRGIKPCCKAAGNCRERAQTALCIPSHGILAKAPQQMGNKAPAIEKG